VKVNHEQEAAASKADRGSCPKKTFMKVKKGQQNKPGSSGVANIPCWEHRVSFQMAFLLLLKNTCEGKQGKKSKRC